MVITDKFIYLELQKTGSSYIRDVLVEVFNAEPGDRHEQVNKELFSGDRLIVGSIRNPWSWYVSLWAFGCQGNGGIYSSLTKDVKRKNKQKNVNKAKADSLNRRRVNAEKWKSLYEDVNDVAAFREWLKLINTPGSMGAGVGGYSNSMFSDHGGLFSFRFMRLYCTLSKNLKNLEGLSSKTDIEEYGEKFCFVDSFIRCESLNGDLIQLLESVNSGVSSTQLSEMKKTKIRNASPRKLSTADYYDEEAEALVAERDSFIIDKFGYEPP